MTHTPILGPEQRTDEWYALRRNQDDPRFGASDAAALLGMSKYKTARHVYEEHFSAEPEPDNENMKIGRVMERPICELYADGQQRSVVHELPTLLHSDYPIFASLDGVTVDASETGPMVVSSHELDWFDFSHLGVKDTALEVKWSMSPQVASQLGDEGSDWVPNEWACQVQQQMDVVNLEVAEIAVFLFGKLRVYKVHRNDDLIDCIHDASQELRERIINGDPPEPDWEHEKTPELVRSLGHDLENVMHCTDKMSKLWASQKLIGQRITRWTRLRKKLQAQFEIQLVEEGCNAAVLPEGGKQVVRRKVARKGYTVADTTYVELREVKS